MDAPKPNQAYRDLFEYLTLQDTGDDRFLAKTRPQKMGRHFGGLIAAQAMLASDRTVPELKMHSLHAYFLRPGAAGGDVTYVVDRIKEGRNFHARDVSALQDGQHIFSMQCSYTRAEKGVAHQEPMPDTPPVARDMVDRDAAGGSPMGPDAFEIRCIDGHPRLDPGPPAARYWCHLRGPAPKDPRLKLALLVYLSDRSLMSAGRRPHIEDVDLRMGASLDHAAWLHRVPNLDDWLMYETASHVAEAGRPLNFGKLYQSDGTLIATLAQEALVRLR